MAPELVRQIAHLISAVVVGFQIIMDVDLDLFIRVALTIMKAVREISIAVPGNQLIQVLLARPVQLAVCARTAVRVAV